MNLFYFFCWYKMLPVISQCRICVLFGHYGPSACRSTAWLPLISAPSLALSRHCKFVVFHLSLIVECLWFCVFIFLSILCSFPPPIFLALLSSVPTYVSIIYPPCLPPPSSVMSPLRTQDVALPTSPVPSLTSATTDHVDSRERSGSIPSPPRDLVASLVSTRFIKLTWRLPAEPHGDNLTYSVFYSLNGSSR